MAEQGEMEGLIRSARALREGRMDRASFRAAVDRWLDGAETTEPRGETSETALYLGSSGSGSRDSVAPDAVRPPEGDDREGRERYQVIGVHASGGLGTVFRAVDTELHREVALKQIRDDRADDPESRWRFEREGTITGALEHPGIVPVYGRGRFPDGRLYFAMRLVRGRSLREAIDDMHRDTAATACRSGQTEPEPHENRPADATLRALIGRLVQACYAVEYAHSQGVIHRDLKPENILLGPFGETLVVDWGLARVADRPDEGGSAVPVPLGTDPWESRPGRVWGTIGYLSPEQARGDLDTVGPRSDVFALGATLYSLLTGRPPIRLEDGPVIALERAVRGEFDPPGAVRPGVDSELERICLRAMDRDPDRRFPTARALAEALEEWLAEERARVARSLFSAALDAYGTLVTTVQDRLRHLPASREVREDLLTRAIAGLENLIAHADHGRTAEVERALAEAHRQIGEIAMRLGRSSEAKRHLERSRQAFEALVAGDRAEPSDHRSLAILFGRLGDVCRRRGDVEQARRSYQRGLAASRAVAKAEPRSGRAQRGVAIAYGKLGDLALQTGDLDAARSYHRRSLAIAEALLRAAPDNAKALRGVAIARDKLGDVARHRGDLAASHRHYRHALAAAEALAAAMPNDLTARRGFLIALNKLGELHRISGNLEPARAAFERALALAESLAGTDTQDADARRDLAICCDRLGDVCRRSGDLQDARDFYRRGLNLARSLAEGDPDDTQARRGLAIALNKLGELHRLSDDLDAAIASYEESFRLIEPMAHADPENVRTQIDAAYGCHRLGDLLAMAGRADEARSWLTRALERLRHLSDRGRLSPAYEGWIAALEQGRGSAEDHVL